MMELKPMKTVNSSKTPPGASSNLVAADVSRRQLQGGKNPPTNVGGYSGRLQKQRAARFLARLRRAALPVALLLAATWGAAAKAPGITATLEPSEIAFGEAAQLTVTVQGQDQNTPELPIVSGLSFQPMGQSSQIQIINGAMSANVSHTYAVTPSRLGTFTIPKMRIGSGREVAESQPLVLKVLKRTGGSDPSATQGSPGKSALPAPAVSGSDEPEDAPDKSSFGFLRLVSPKKEFYVGELVPVELKAYFRAGVELRVDGLPRLNSDAFAMNKLGDEPARGQQVIGGVPYTVLTWSTAITAVKAGGYEMSVEIPTTVTVRQRAQRPRARVPNPFGNGFFDEVFNDAFFDNFFGAATQKQVALSSQAATAKILSLPAEGRPADFSGAVGRFDFAVSAAPTQAAAGDPVTLTIKISGSGNFDRANTPGVERSDVWKTYKPGARFAADDSAGYAGTKTFEQALVPMQSGKLVIPALQFSFFDPEVRQYVTRTAAPIGIEVAPGQVAAAPASPPAPAAPSPSPVPLPNRLRPAAFAAALPPWIYNPRLAAGVVAAVLAGLSISYLVRRQQRLANDPERLRLADTRRAVQSHLQNMESAVSQGTAADFFTAARGAFQSQLGLRWGLPPRTITLADINARMNGEAEGFRFVFELADEVAYTGRTFAAGELQQYLRTVEAELLKMEARITGQPQIRRG